MNYRTMIAAFALGASLSAQLPKFASPVRLEAGGKLLGAERLYPSPVYHDMNGDGLADIVVGDLRGHLTVALRDAGPGTPRFAAESQLNGADQRPLDFENW